MLYNYNIYVYSCYKIYLFTHLNNNNSDEFVIPLEHGYYMCIISSLSLLSGIYAVKKKLYNLAMVPIGVWLTSINYWHFPIYSWRRNLDITYVTVALTYQVCKSYSSKNIKQYCLITGLGISFYPFSWYLHKKNYLWSSTIAHSMIHILGSLANVILYTGFN
jgi:hypothetical protein